MVESLQLYIELSIPGLFHILDHVFSIICTLGEHILLETPLSMWFPQTRASKFKWNYINSYALLWTYLGDFYQHSYYQWKHSRSFVFLSWIGFPPGGNFRVFRLRTWVYEITIYSVKWTHMKLLLITINPEVLGYDILAEICTLKLLNAYTRK